MNAVSTNYMIGTEFTDAMTWSIFSLAKSCQEAFNKALDVCGDNVDDKCFESRPKPGVMVTGQRATQRLGSAKGTIPWWLL